MINVGSDAFPLGHLSFDSTMSGGMLDVTPFVLQHADSLMSFVLVREQQYAAETDDGNLVTLLTRESGANGPQLMLFTVPEPAKPLIFAPLLTLFMRRKTRRVAGNID